jgi:membrane associated rhomboid family serine protease
MSVYSALQANPDDNVAHLAHLGGMVVGYVLIRLWRHRGR